MFGPGELAWEYRFVAPGYKSQVANVDLTNFNSEIQRLYTKDALKRYTDPERVRRMLYFSASSAGDLIGWDPVEITNPDNCEYAIYIVGGRNSPRKLVGSFAEFINKVCLAPENLDIPGRDPSLPTRRMFQEACDTSGL